MKFDEKLIKEQKNNFILNEEPGVDLLIQNNKIQAIVKGNPNHEVNFILDNGKIVEIDCDCQDAQEGGYCEHMNAAISKVEELIDIISKNDIFQKDEESKLKNLIKNASREDIDSFLFKALSQDDYLLELFEKYTKLDESEVFDNAMDKINDIFEMLENGYDYEDSDEAYDEFADELSTIIDEDIQYFVNKKEYASTLDLISNIFDLMPEIEDEYFDKVDYLGSRTSDIFVTLLKEADLEIKKDTFNLIISILDDQELCWMHDKLLHVLMHNCPNDYEEEKINFLKAKEEKFDEVNYEPRDMWDLCYAFSMIGLPQYKEQFIDFCMKHLDNIEIAELLIRHYNLRRNFDESFAIIDKCSQLNEDNMDVQGELQLSKKDIYEKLNDKQNYLDTLWELVTEYYPGDLDLIDELKDAYPEDVWSQKREELLNHISDDNLLDVLAHEGMYKELFEKVNDSDDIRPLMNFDYLLKDNYSKEIVDKYVNYLQQKVAMANSYGDYQHILIILYGLTRIDGGNKAIEKLIEEWNLEYKDKPELLELLNNFEY